MKKTHTQRVSDEDTELDLTERKRLEKFQIGRKRFS